MVQRARVGEGHAWVCPLPTESADGPAQPFPAGSTCPAKERFGRDPELVEIGHKRLRRSGAQPNPPDASC